MSAFSPPERLLRWGEIISQTRGRLVVESLKQPQFAASISVATLGPVRLFRVNASPHRLERASGPTGADVVPLLIQARGTAVIMQEGRETVLRPGCWTAWRANLPHTVTSLTEVEQYGVMVPSQWLRMHPHEIRARCGRLYHNTGVGKLLFHHIIHLFEELGSIDGDAHGDLADIVGHLIRLAMAEVRSQDRPIQAREVLRGRIVDYIRHHLRDPNLSLDRLAEKFGCTKRHLHNAFNESGTTLNQFIWQERLERCREALANPDLADRSVTEIAFAWGFNNSSHFSKVFKERFGTPPGVWRTQCSSTLPS